MTPTRVPPTYPGHLNSKINIYDLNTVGYIEKSYDCFLDQSRIGSD